MTTIMLITVLVVAAAMLTLQLRAHRVARAGRAAPTTGATRRPSRTPPGLHDGWLEPVGGDRR